MDMTSYDIIIINTSAGKDSQVMLEKVVTLAKEQGVMDRVSAVHCDLGKMEWEGTRDLAQAQCDFWGVPLIVVSRSEDILTQVEKRGMWPSSTARYCTSDHKRDQAVKVVTQLVNNLPDMVKQYSEVFGQDRWYHRGQAKVLNCMGFRSQESAARAKRQVLETGSRGSSGKRQIDTWLPIFDMTETEVWASIKASGVPYHRAYDLGMPRLSCVFCIFAPRKALIIAGINNPELLNEYVAVEQRIGHTFKAKETIESIRDAIAAGEDGKGGMGKEWNM